MADNENDSVEPEGEEEQDSTKDGGEEEPKQEEAAEEGGEAEAGENPPVQEEKDDGDKVEETPEGGVEENPVTEEGGEGAEQPEEGDVEKKEEAVEGEQAEGEAAKGEATDAEDAGEANVEPSESVEVVDAPSDAVDAGDETVAAGDANEDGEAAESAETETPAEAAEGGEIQSSDVTKDGEAEEPGEEGAEKASEEVTAGEEGEKPTEENEEEGQKEEGAIAEEGDRKSSPVGEKLSREPTPDIPAPAEVEHERLEATTPDNMDQIAEYRLSVQEQIEQTEVEDEDIDDDSQVFKREDLIDKYQEALVEREQLQQHNHNLQHKLAEYFRKKKADERQDYDKNVTDQEQRYLKYMAQLEDLRRQDMLEKENCRLQREEAKDRCQDKKEKVDFERKKFMDFKKQVALNAVNSRSGKPIPPKDIEQYLVNEVKKEQEVVHVRLENIKLKNKLKKKEQQLKSKEELAEGLHLIDFEQLKIENQTYNEKIEERNEELLKLRKKITSTVQVLTHLKEKLQFVQGENLEQSKSLKEVEASLAQSRDILSRTKQARDALRIDNQKLRQNCGLLGNEPLLRDFEERKDEADELHTKLEELRMQHADLTLHCNQVRRKIEQAREHQ